MSGGRGPDRQQIPRLAVVAVLGLFVVGVFPLPMIVPDGGLWRENLRFWSGAALLTVGPVLALAALPLPWLRALPFRLAAWLRRPSPLAFAVLIGAAFAALSTLLASYAFHFAPTTADEIAQLWHARILLHGHLALPADPNAEFFAVDNVIDTGKWYSQFPIGGPLVLAVAYLIRVPWLLDPLLGGLTAALLYHFARRAYGETQGRAVAVLFALSPVTLLMSASYMNHVPVLLLAVAVLAALTEWERAVTPRARHGHRCRHGLRAWRHGHDPTARRAGRIGVGRRVPTDGHRSVTPPVAGPGGSGAGRCGGRRTAALRQLGYHRRNIPFCL